MSNAGSAGRSGRPAKASGETDSPALKLWVVLARVHQSLAGLASADAARHGLTLAEFGVLEALYHKGPMLLSEVQRKILISSGGITQVVDRLASKDLVERRPCPEDGRARRAALTRKGRALIARIFPEHAQTIVRGCRGLDDREMRRASALLRRLGRTAEEQQTTMKERTDR